MARFDIIDSNVLIESACGDRDLALELLEFFFDQAGQEMACMTQAATAGNVSVVAASAHKMVGSAVACGLIGLTNELRDLEQHCRQDGMPSDIDGRIRRLTLQLSDARTFFEANWTVD